MWSSSSSDHRFRGGATSLCSSPSVCPLLRPCPGPHFLSVSPLSLQGIDIGPFRVATWRRQASSLF